jgi:hypothetical protein
MRQSIERYSYVWIIPGWYADRWWETGGDVILDDCRCSNTELAMFIVHQRVIAISHHPYIMLNSTLSEDGVCVSSLDTSFILTGFRDKTRKLCVILSLLLLIVLLGNTVIGIPCVYLMGQCDVFPQRDHPAVE